MSRYDSSRSRERYRNDDRYYDRKHYSRSPSPNNIRPPPYDPIKAGTIDGSGSFIHDKGILRALKANYNPNKDRKIKGDKYKTLFVARLNRTTTEETLEKVFSEFGKITHLRLVRDIITGRSKGYAFISYKHRQDFVYAWKKAHGMIIDGAKILVEFERGRTVEGWIPRRFGGGLGGKKESGQLRFGGRDLPFKKRYSKVSNHRTNILNSNVLDDMSNSGVVMNIEDDETGSNKTLLMKEHKSMVIIKDIS